MIGVPNLISNTNGSYACIDQTNNKHFVHDKGFGITSLKITIPFAMYRFTHLLTNCIGSDHPAGQPAGWSEPMLFAKMFITKGQSVHQELTSWIILSAHFLHYLTSGLEQEILLGNRIMGNVNKVNQGIVR